uniref:Alpha-tocopherol transfer protein-like n=2 Tax=Culex pipiens TaxID=7175 RepID=A0A8D8M9X3_CULPI
MVNLAIRPVPEPLCKKARAELNEQPERIQEDIALLRQWIAKSPHLRSRIDDQFLVAFLRGCKYSLERAKEKLDMFYTVRTMSPELIRTRDPLDPKTREIIRMGVGVPLPLTDGPDAPRVLLIRPAAYDPPRTTIEEVIRVSTMANDIMITYVELQVQKRGQDRCCLSRWRAATFLPVFMAVLHTDGSSIVRVVRMF